MSDAYIVGAGMIPFGRYPDRAYFQLAADATLMALDDCGLSIKDVGVVYASSTFNAASMPVFSRSWPMHWAKAPTPGSTMQNPADPVNPVSHCRRSSRAATYSP